MKLWGYYAIHTFWNSIRKMFRSTVLVIILACVGFIGICGIAGGVIGSVVAGHEESSEVSTEAVSEDAGDDEIEEASGEDDEMSPEDVAMAKTWVEAAVGLILLVVLLWGIYSGSKSGTDIFQMVAAFAASLYLIFQIPNLVKNLGLGVPAVAAMYLWLCGGSISGAFDWSCFCRGKSVGCDLVVFYTDCGGFYVICCGTSAGSNSSRQCP